MHFGCTHPVLSVHAIGGMQCQPIAHSFYPIAISNRLSLHPIARAFVTASVDRRKSPLIAYGSPLIADNAPPIAGTWPRIADHRIPLQQTPSHCMPLLHIAPSAVSIAYYRVSLRRLAYHRITLQEAPVQSRIVSDIASAQSPLTCDYVLLCAILLSLTPRF